MEGTSASNIYTYLFILLFFIYTYLIFIYLAVLGLSCSVWGLHCVLWDVLSQHMDSSCGIMGLAVGMHRLSCPLAYGMLVLPARD